MSNKTSIVQKYFLISIILTLSFVLLFVGGLEAARFVYLSAFGEPYEMGWLILYLMGKVFGFVFGLIGTIVISIATIFLDKRKVSKVGKYKYPTVKVFFTVYVFVILELLFLLVLINAFIPPCPNCYK